MGERLRLLSGQYDCPEMDERSWTRIKLREKDEGLPYLLTGEGVGVISAEDEDLEVLM